MDLGLSGVGAAVAGGSRGLGFAVAHELAVEGARVALCSRSLDAATEAAARIATEGGEAHGLEADVSTSPGARDFIERAAERLGALAILVCNAGGPPPGPPDSHSDEAWLEALEMNFLSTVRMCRAALPHMREGRWGRIVVITSNVVKQPDISLSLSSAARSAATAFAKTLADTVAADGITVNCAMPGQILTDRLRTLAGAPAEADGFHDAFKMMTDRIPAGRLGTPAEFAAAVTFLCSKRASFITGVSLAIDGGFLRALV